MSKMMIDMRGGYADSGQKTRVLDSGRQSHADARPDIVASLPFHCYLPNGNKGKQYEEDKRGISSYQLSTPDVEEIECKEESRQHTDCVGEGVLAEPIENID